MNRSPSDPIRNDALAPAAEGRLTEWLLRGFALLMLGIAVSNIAIAWWQDRSRLTLLLLLITEGYTLMLVLFARRAYTRDIAPLTILATFYAAFFFVLFETRDTTRWIPELAGVALQVCGTLWQFSAKFVLGRSFGLLPAHRGLVIAGPYRLVRHPIYFGYLISHVGFLLVNFSWRNASILVLLYAAQLVRINREEALLASDSGDYRAYQTRVRWRLVPFVY